MPTVNPAAQAAIRPNPLSLGPNRQTESKVRLAVADKLKAMYPNTSIDMASLKVTFPNNSSSDRKVAEAYGSVVCRVSVKVGDKQITWPKAQYSLHSGTWQHIEVQGGRPSGARNVSIEGQIKNLAFMRLLQDLYPAKAITDLKVTFPNNSSSDEQINAHYGFCVCNVSAKIGGQRLSWPNAEFHLHSGNWQHFEAQ